MEIRRPAQDDPLQRFLALLQRARGTPGIVEPTAMTLATVGADGRPSARVGLRGDAGAAAARLVRAALEAAHGGVLEEPRRSAARTRAVHAGEAGRALVGAAAQPVIERTGLPAGGQSSGICPAGAGGGGSSGIF